jgi:hypothetical protein
MSLIDRMFPKLPTAAPAAEPQHGSAGPAPTTNGTAHASAATSVAAPAQDLLGPAELVERRRVLQEQFAELQWNLGGVAYEMAIRDHFRLDLLVRRAAQLQQIDAELGEVERLLRLEQAGAAGACPSCEALHGRGAVFCWQCGGSLMEQATVSTSGDLSR